MAGNTPGTTNDSDTFSTVEDAMGSYVSDEEQGDGQGGQPDKPQDGKLIDENGNPIEPSHEQEGTDPDLDDLGDGTDDIDASGGDQPDPDQAAGFVAHDAKVKLADGTVTTVAEIVRGTMRNADYSQKATKLAEERQQFDGIRQQVRQQYETVTQQQQRLAAIAQAFLPQRPDPAKFVNPAEYNIMLDGYNRHVEMLQSLDADYRQNIDTQDAEQKKSLQDFRDQQADKLVERDPKFNDDGYYRQFWDDAIKIGGRVYGYTSKELTEGMNDHRQYLVMRDALAFQRLKAKQRAAKGQGQGQRQTPSNGQGRQPLAVNGRPQNVDAAKRKVAQDRFAKNPSMKNAIDLID